MNCDMVGTNLTIYTNLRERMKKPDHRWLVMYESDHVVH